MYHGKYRKTKQHKTSPFILLASLVLLLTMSVLGTMAYLTDAETPIENKFTPTKVPNSVVETINGGVKSDVKIKNNGNTDAYVRAAVVVNWADGNGNVWGQPPKDSHYTLTFATGTGWEKGKDGYYYYITGSIAPNAETGVLISEAKLNAGVTPPTGYSLSVEIMGQTVQAKGVTGTSAVPVVQTLWPVTVNDNGSLALK